MGILRNRNFRTLLVGRLVSNYGNNLYTLALPWYIYALTNSKLDLSLVGMADYLPYLAGFFVGAFVDRWRKQHVMLTTDGIRAVLALGIVAVVTLHGTFAAIFTVALLIQLVGSFFSPAAAAITPLLVSSDELPQAMGLMQSSSGVVELLGMASGGPLMAVLQVSGLFLIDALSFIASFVSVLMVRVQEEVGPFHLKERPSVLVDWKDGFKTLIRSKSILQIFVGGFFTNFGMAPMTIVLTAWVKGPLHGSSVLYGVTLGCMVFGTIVGGLTLGFLTNYVSPKSVLRTGLLVLGVCTLLVSVWTNRYWCCALLILSGFAIASLNGALEVLLVKVVPQSMRGRMFGMFNGLMVTVSPLGLLVFGLLLIRLQMWMVWLAMGTLAIIGSLAYFVRIEDDLHQLSEQPSA